MYEIIQNLYMLLQQKGIPYTKSVYGRKKEGENGKGSNREF